MIAARRRLWKRIVLIVWLLLIASLFYAVKKSGIPLQELPDYIRDHFEAFGALGPVAYIVIYTLRPFTLFPAFVFNAAAGLVWGPFWGIVYTLIGENLSAGFAFWVARWFGQDWFSWAENHMWQNLERLLKKNGFLTVLFMRLAYMPFDVVNFGCGLTQVRYAPYAWGTAVGTIPAVVTFVYFGDSWFNPGNLVVSGGVFLVSLGIAKLVKSSRLLRALFEVSNED